MAFIETIPLTQASGSLREMYERAQAGTGFVPNHTKLFSLRPEVNAAWAGLVGSVRAHMDLRRYELVTLAAARALGSSYCSLAHGTVLQERVLEAKQLEAITRDRASAGLQPVEVAIMDFAEHVVTDAPSVTATEVQNLRAHGLSDAEIFDVAAVAAARCFFSTLLDALGAEPDSVYAERLDGTLLEQLTVGRAISEASPERL